MHERTWRACDGCSYQVEVDTFLQPSHQPYNTLQGRGASACELTALNPNPTARVLTQFWYYVNSNYADAPEANCCRYFEHGTSTFLSSSTPQRVTSMYYIASMRAILRTKRSCANRTDLTDMSGIQLHQTKHLPLHHIVIGSVGGSPLSQELPHRGF
jgi:hypothetical protein